MALDSVNTRNVDLYSKRIVTSGSITYVAEAPPQPGRALTDKAWRIRKIDATNAADLLIQWADGDPSFHTNADGDLSGKSYS